MSIRLLALFLLPPALLLGPVAGSRSPAQDRRAGFAAEVADPFAMPRHVPRPTSRAIEPAAFLGPAGTHSPVETRYGNPPGPFAERPAGLPAYMAQAPALTPAPIPYDADPQTIYPLQPSPDVYYAEHYPWTWEMLPDGVLYKSYMAGTRESRISGGLLYDTSDGWMLDSTLGGRRGILRYGTPGSNADGWQLDVEGAAFIRLNIEEEWDVDSADFRFGVPLTFRRGRWQWKTGYYHLSAHAGDEFMEREPGFQRINYVRDAVFFGLGYYLIDDVRLYGEAGYAFNTDGGAEPFEFQLGADYSPAIDNPLRGAPYAAINVHLREEVDYGGGVNVMAGWRWKGPVSGNTIRAGVQYYNGKKTQYAFFREHEELIGFGLWYDY